ncbi:hypothetical protein M407DRAFT_34867 [Tulasnella calospora MUT 4182]|uniref:Uncharacterized protein n=1 Tax=Tulasnella calospora MUT 4182 TaxID=1051891 RepID=A0A0C3PMI0_9AGAM|nr:hypothetical protein M407DRAFT_34867 [Tulasnella calospora MUT 4182]
MHYNRNIEPFAKKLSLDDFKYVRSLPYLKSQAEVDRFGDFCTQSEFKELKDWWSHKKSYSWLLPSIVGCLSKIAPEDRRLIPDNTNAIEGDHSMTNKYTGTHLTLIDAIQRARDLDALTAATARATIDSGIYPNSLNTPYHRTRANMARTAWQAEKAKAKADKKNSTPRKSKAPYRPPV